MKPKLALEFVKNVSIFCQPIIKTERKDMAVRNASNALGKVFKGLFAHRLCKPPVNLCQMIKV